MAQRLKNITSIHNFELDFSTDFPPVMAQPQLIEDVLTNLVENAMKYSPKGGKIKVSGTISGGQVRITVADEGVGIPAAEIEHIFTRFYRVSSSLTQRVQGVGLGLYLCKSIIDLHGGTIEAASQRGKGSRFTFMLPLEPSPKREE